MEEYIPEKREEMKPEKQIISGLNGKFEVEVRCHFESVSEAFDALPFLHSCLKRRYTWKTNIHGLQLFQSGQLLRTAEVEVDNQYRCFIGWKGPDTGDFSNIRQEIDEDITSGSAESKILASLGGKRDVSGFRDLIQELDLLGYPQFMLFEGHDLAGYYEPYGIKLKLLNCTRLKWPLLVEIEKVANSAEEAVFCEQSLHDFCDQFQLQNRIVKEEPPTLLYQAVFA